jgi:ribosome maturation factor RimP
MICCTTLLFDYQSFENREFLHIFAKQKKRGPIVPSFHLSKKIAMGVEKRIRELVEEKLADRPDLFIVAIKMINNAKIMVLLDGDEGVGIHDCAMVSRHVGFHLEEENLIEKAYNLEVSSPGLDTPFVLNRQYVKNIGRDVIVKLANGEKLEGKLLQVAEGSIIVSHSVKEKGKKAQLIETEIQKDNIAETKVSVSFK